MRNTVSERAHAHPRAHHSRVKAQINTYGLPSLKDVSPMAAELQAETGQHAGFARMQVGSTAGAVWPLLAIK